MALTLLPTGIPGLDNVLGGGLPEYSFNMIAGPPGSGKTTLAHQLLFANASAERPAIYFTVLGEPALKMLRYQQQMGFFDPEKVGRDIRFVDLSREVLAGDLGAVLSTIVEHVQATSPAMVVVDSFRTVARTKRATGESEAELQSFLQQLGLHLTSWQVTSFVIGEYGREESTDNPVFTIADGIIWLTQVRYRNSIVRKIEVMKVRGQPSVPGTHSFRITDTGLEVFPRMVSVLSRSGGRLDTRRLPLGIPKLDHMLGGGIVSGDGTLVVGPSGTGKTTLSTHFLFQGVKDGDTAVLATFEEHPDDYLVRAEALGFDLRAMVDAGKLVVVYMRPLDLSPDEILHQIQQAVTQIGAKRLVIDSLNGVEIALAPDFREDFRESLYRLVGSLTGAGVSVLMTYEITEEFHQIRFSQHAVSFLAQNVIFLRYIEHEGRLKKVLAVIKMRRSSHSREFCEYDVDVGGLQMLRPLHDLHGILTGVPTRVSPDHSGGDIPTDLERTLLARVIDLGQVSAAALAAATGFVEAEVTRVLRRLVTLDHLRVWEEGGETIYRPVVGRPTGG